MRVALVCGDYRPSRDGVAHYTARLAAELASRGVQVVVATGAPEARDAADEDPGTAAPWVVTPGWTPAGVARAARALRAAAPDVVHVQFAPSAYGWNGAVGLLPALLGRTRLVTTVHEYNWWSWTSWAPRRLAPLLQRAWPHLERRRWWDRETGLLTTRSSAVVTTNPAHAEALAARLPGVPVAQVPIGANLRVVARHRDEARQAVRARLGLAADTPVLAFFGFVHAVKGIRYLVEALALVRRDHPDAHLLLVGGFESLALRGREAVDYRGEVEAMIAERGLAAAVTLTGWQPEDEVSRLLSAADVAVLPFTSGTTTKSGSLLACAEHGLPIVATAADPADPALLDGDAALLVPVRDGPALAKAVTRVLEDPGLAAALSAGAQRLAAAHGWAAIADAHLRLYEGLGR
jgi:glycosyltransferase involved in cell wall biosynthesis